MYAHALAKIVERVKDHVDAAMEWLKKEEDMFMIIQFFPNRYACFYVGFQNWPPNGTDWKSTSKKGKGKWRRFIPIYLSIVIIGPTISKSAGLRLTMFNK